MVTVHLEARQPQRVARLPQRQVDHAAAFHPLIAVVEKLQHRLEVIDREFGDDADRTRRGILAVQGSLGTAQHLDALHIDQIADAHPGATLVNTVDKDAHTGVDAGVGPDRADAANTDGCGARIAARRDLQAGRVLLQPRQVVDPGVTEEGTGEGRHRNRHLLQAFRLAAGRDDHLFHDQIRVDLGACRDREG